MILCDCSCLV